MQADESSDRDVGEDRSVVEPAAGRAAGPSSRLQRLRSIEGAAVAGIIAAVGWVVALAGLLDIPDADATDVEILSHYDALSDSSAALVYLQILVVATIAFLWFVGVIRHRIGAREPKLFGTVFLGGGILLAGLLFVGLASAAAPAVLVGQTDRSVDPDVAATTRVLAQILLAVFAPRIAAVFIFTTSTLALRTGAMSRWFVGLSLLTGLGTLLNVTFAEPNIYVFPVWMAAVSLYLLIVAHDFDGAVEQR